MDYIFESMMMKYDEMVVNEYCYGESYYTEAEKKGLLEKIGEFISNLCEKVMNLVKSFVNKIAGKDVFVKVPKDMVDRVKKAESWFDLFKKAVDAIKRGVIKAIKELVELMKKHPLMTTAVVTTAGFVFVKAGAYKKMATTLATIGGRIKDAVKYIIGKKDMVDKDIYDASVATLKSSQVALNKAQADLTACKVESAKKDDIISDKNTELGVKNSMLAARDLEIDKQKKRIDKVSHLASNRRLLNKKLIEDGFERGVELSRVKKNLRNKEAELNESIYASTMKDLKSMSVDDPMFKKFMQNPEIQQGIDEYVDKSGKGLSKLGRKHLMSYVSNEYNEFRKKNGLS